MEKPYKLLYPMRVCLISASYDGKDNFMPATWVYPVSADPPLFGVGISRKRHTYGMIKESGYFVINIPGFELKGKLEQFGRTTGKEADKFEVWELTAEKSEKIPCISIKETLCSMEMKVVQEIELGDHVLFVGELVNLKKRRDEKPIYQAEEGYITL